MRNTYVIPIPNAMKGASSVWNNYQTHKRVRNWWKKLEKIMNLTHFHPENIENVAKNNSSVNIRSVTKTSDIKISLKKQDLMLKYQKWQHWRLGLQWQFTLGFESNSTPVSTEAEAISTRQGRIKGGAMGVIAPGPPLQGAPPWWNLFVSNKLLVWKIFVIQKRYKNTTLYYIPMLR